MVSSFALQKVHKCISFNFILYIYKCKFNEAKPNTIELKNKIKKYQSFDQYIAKKNNTVQKIDTSPIYIILN
jgi:hypothetical protein